MQLFSNILYIHCTKDNCYQIPTHQCKYFQTYFTFTAQKVIVIKFLHISAIFFKHTCEQSKYCHCDVVY